MKRHPPQEESLGSFLSLIFEADEPKKKKKKSETSDVGAAGKPLEFPDDQPDDSEPSPRRMGEPFNPLKIPAGEGKPHHVMPTKRESPREKWLQTRGRLRKLDAALASGQISTEEFWTQSRALRGQLKSLAAGMTQDPEFGRRGTSITPGGTLPKELPPTDDTLAAKGIENIEPEDEMEMEPYQGSREKISRPNASHEDSDQKSARLSRASKKGKEDPADKLTQYQSIAKSLGSRDPTKIKGKENDQEWTEDDLPVASVGRGISSTQGAKNVDQEAQEKKILTQLVPKFVLQGMVKAAQDYKEELRAPLGTIKRAGQQYANLLRGLSAGRSKDAPEKAISPEEYKDMSTGKGLAHLVGMEPLGDEDPSGGFSEFWNEWKLGKPMSTFLGEPLPRPIPGATPAEARSIQSQPLLYKSAWNVIKRLGIVDLDDDTPAEGDTGPMIGLETQFKPEVSRIEQFLMARKNKGEKSAGDPGFRYFFGEKPYWDWIRRQARKAGKYPEGEKWAWKGKQF